MGQLMAKEVSGGTCGGSKLFNLLDRVSLNSWTPKTLSFPMWFSRILHFGTFTLSIAGKLLNSILQSFVWRLGCVLYIHKYLREIDKMCGSTLNLSTGGWSWSPHLSNFNSWITDYEDHLKCVVYISIYIHAWCLAVISSHTFFFCSNVVIRYVTILAPSDSPNTDGIDPGNTIFSALYVVFLTWFINLFILRFLNR